MKHLPSNQGTNKLNRFTTLPYLLEMLDRKRLVFSNPKHWEDKNDSEVLEIYKNKKYAQNANAKLFTLCFLEDDETIHHWKAYAEGILGCCIEFDKEQMLEFLSKRRKSGINFGSVVYKRLKDLGHGTADEYVHMIPFIKRWPYRVEKEFRIIWDGIEGKDPDPYDIPFKPRDLIRKITLSPEMPKNIFSVVQKNLIKKLRKLKFKVPRKSDKLVNHSKIFEDRERWIKKFNRFKNGSNCPATS